VTVWSDLRARIGSLLRGHSADRDTQRELAFHLERETERLVGEGIEPAEARRRARLRLGGVEQIREETRDARGVRWIEDAVRDGRHALRQLGRTPGFTAVSLLTLALGIGANTAIYSVVDGVLRRPVPFADPNRLVMIWETDRRSGTTREPASWPDLGDIRSRSTALASVAGFTGVDATFSPPDGEPTRIAAMAVTHEYFPLLGVRPIVGRLFTEAEDRENGPAVAQVGERMWRSRFGADPALVGRTIRVEGRDLQVVGVLPASAEFGIDQIHARASYHGTYLGPVGIDLWIPLQASERRLPRDTHPILTIGRLRAGATVGDLQRDLDRIMVDLERTYRSNSERGAYVEPLAEVAFGSVRPLLRLLAGAVGLLLLVACVNVANLLLARGASRSREVAVRAALGAARARIGRQFFAEAVALALLGGLLGVGVAVGGLRVLLALAPSDIPRIGSVGIDPWALTITLLVSVGAGLGFGLVPALQAQRTDPISAIKADPRGGTISPGARRLRDALVVGELALSVTLVVGAGLVIRSFSAVVAIDPGFRAERVVKTELQLPAERYPQDFSKWPAWPAVLAFDARVTEALGRDRTLEAATLASAHPLDRGFTNSFVVVGREADANGPDWPEISVRAVWPTYGATLGTALVRGRFLAESDGPTEPPVAVVNEAAVAQYFRNGDPIGQSIRFWGSARRIVGVIGNERLRGPAEPTPPAVYVSIPQAPSPTVVVMARAAGSPDAALAAIRRAIHAVDPAIAIYGAEPLETTLAEAVAERKFAMVLLATFAGVTLALALIGVHGVLSYIASQRTREMGIRLALGATRRQVVGLMLRSGAWLGVTGVAIGLGGAAVGSSVLRSLLFGVGRLDPATFLAVPAIVLLATLAASWLPARRAGRSAPLEILKE
jgi:predicted permease